MGNEGKSKWIKMLPLVVEMHEKRNLAINDISRITGIPRSSLARLLETHGVVIKKKRYIRRRK